VVWSGLGAVVLVLLGCSCGLNFFFGKKNFFFKVVVYDCLVPDDRYGGYLKIFGLFFLSSVMDGHYFHLYGQLEDVDDQIQKLNEKRARITMEIKKAEGSDQIREIPEMQEQTKAIERYTHLKKELHLLYNGRASEYDPTAGGYLFPPHGMCPADCVLKMVDSFQSQVTVAEQAIAKFEEELKKHPYISPSPHPMIILQSPPIAASNDRRMACHAGEERNNIIRKITGSMGDKLIAQDGLDFWKKVKPASEQYMKEINGMFIEKAKLRQQILVKYGMALPSW
jgi:hypothetical protein